MTMDDKKPAKHDVPISGHEYDGISEFDNQLPRWWLYMFYLTIAFAGGYFAYYHMGSGPSQKATFEAARAEVDADRAKAEAAASVIDEAALKAALANPDELAKGKLIFGIRCASCHGDLGQGKIGPNLTDAYWLHGGSFTDIAHTVTTGVVDKGMPAWGKVMKREGLIRVIAYVKSLKGSNPPNPKAPQGELYKGD